LSNLDDPSVATTTTAVLQGLLNDGAAEMRSYLIRAVDAAILDLWESDPTTAPAQVKRRNGDISRYLGDRLDPREDVLNRYKLAIQWLKDVANKVVDLGVSPALAVGNSGGVNFDAAPSVLADGTFTFGYGQPWQQGGGWRGN
jgi:phage gp36-like protein